MARRTRRCATLVDVPRPAPPPIDPPLAGDLRYRMLVAYDGAEFHGFAANPGVATVAGTLQQSLRRILGYEATLTCAGRTDAGVHGWGQVVSFDAGEFSLRKVQQSLNKLCGPAIVVRELEVADDHFDARHSAKARLYHYRVLNRRVPDPFLHRTTWQVSADLDLDAMNAGGAHLLGEHDFASFCRKRHVRTEDGTVEASLTRLVEELQWERLPDDIVRLTIGASAFCQQMVRSIAGTLVDVGTGKFTPDDIPAILAARDRNAAGQVAPPQGLTLMSVTY